MRYALSPATLRDYDEALSLRKHAAEGASSAVVSPTAPSPPTPTTYKAQKPPPQPGDYKAPFLDNSGLAAQASSATLFQEGKEKSMPVTR